MSADNNTPFMQRTPSLTMWLVLLAALVAVILGVYYGTDTSSKPAQSGISVTTDTKGNGSTTVTQPDGSTCSYSFKPGATDGVTHYTTDC